MKKLLGIVVLGLLLNTNAYSGSTTGSGDLKLSRGVLSGFIKYLDFNAVHNKMSQVSPALVLFTQDSISSTFSGGRRKGKLAETFCQQPRMIQWRLPENEEAVCFWNCMF